MNALNTQTTVTSLMLSVAIQLVAMSVNVMLALLVMDMIVVGCSVLGNCHCNDTLTCCLSLQCVLMAMCYSVMTALHQQITQRAQFWCAMTMSMVQCVMISGTI